MDNIENQAPPCPLCGKSIIRYKTFQKIKDTNITLCRLTLRNGFVVTGESFSKECIENPNAAEQEAFDFAFEKARYLESYVKQEMKYLESLRPEKLHKPA